MKFDAKRTHLLLAAAGCLAASTAAPGWAQVGVSADAFTGGRFGVGRITFGLSRQMQPEVLGSEALGLDEKDGRVLYPVIQPPPLGGLFADLLGRPHPTTVYFLFRSEGPLELTLRGRKSAKITVTPRHDPAANRQLLRQWWDRYTAPPGLLRTAPDYPPLVDNYLKSTLARRLSLKLPEKELTESWRDRLAEEVGLTLGTASIDTGPIRVAMQQDRILGLNHLDQAADRPLPEPIAPQPSRFPPPAAEVKIEPIALRVPGECFYIRFGSFGNFLWAQDTIEKWGGDLQNLIATRGLDYDIIPRMEQQLVLKQTFLSRLLGGTMIADVAMIGADVFFREGAAYGLLFYARQNELLGTSIVAERAARLKAGGVSETRLMIAEHSVSLLASPDGAVRSYYAADGDYHFVTTSKTLVRRFLETASGAGALGRGDGFRHARSVMPLARQDTVFVYLSDAFFRNFTGPHYRVETARRLQAASDIDLVQLATLASATEGKPGDTIEQLIAGELLPPEFGPRSDGSRTVLTDGEVYDQLRGRRGALLPVPDVPVTGVTRAEAAAYAKFADFYREQWGRLDPVMIAVKRSPLAENREKVVIDLRMSPFAVEHYETLSEFAGPVTGRNGPGNSRLAPIEGDVIAGELMLADQHVFAGLADFGSPLQNIGESFLSLGRLRDVLVGYVGTSGPIGLLGILDVQIPAPPDAQGYSSNRLGLWRRQFDGFTVFSLHPEVLEAVTPQLRFQPAPRPAQLRLRVGDLSQAPMTPFLNGWGYSRTRETSLGNLRLINDLAQQLHVPPEDCKQAAELLLGARLVCPLGGEYVFQENPDGAGWWTSTALTPEVGLPLIGPRPPEGYQAPPLNWFRGLDFDAAMTEEAFSAHAELIMQLPPEE